MILWLQAAVSAARAIGGLAIEVTRPPNGADKATFLRSQAFHALAAVGEAMMIDDDFREGHAMPVLRALCGEIHRRQQEAQAKAQAQVVIRQPIIIPTPGGFSP
jgi:hypothetical protein